MNHHKRSISVNF